MRTFGDARIPETASEIKSEMLEKLNMQVRGERPDDTGTSSWTLEGFTKEQLERVIDFVRSFDDERVIPEFEAYSELGQ